MTPKPKVEVRRRERDDQPELREGWTRVTGQVVLPDGQTIEIVEQSTEPIDVDDEDER